jgi:hypothetical protein
MPSATTFRTKNTKRVIRHDWKIVPKLIFILFPIEGEFLTENIINEVITGKICYDNVITFLKR